MLEILFARVLVAALFTLLEALRLQHPHSGLHRLGPFLTSQPLVKTITLHIKSAVCDGHSLLRDFCAVLCAGACAAVQVCAGACAAVQVCAGVRVQLCVQVAVCAQVVHSGEASVCRCGAAVLCAGACAAVQLCVQVRACVQVRVQLVQLCVGACLRACAAVCAGAWQLCVCNCVLVCVCSCVHVRYCVQLL
jgi:hypothetical protein